MRTDTTSLLDALRRLFPACVTEAQGQDGQLRPAVDFDALRQELSDQLVDGPAERYQLNWPGKRAAMALANEPCAKTLRPCPEDSVNFETTKNLFIEGDNLDALKLLQETYLGRVKTIYIDPPYNTGKDFIYSDKFTTDKKTYQEQTKARDEEGDRLVANPDTSGRFHSNWLSMMYPRLKLARNLLSQDGVIFISIDDHENHNLRKLMDEIFGAVNFVNCFTWVSNLTGRQIRKSGAAKTHEQVLVYAKNIDEIALWRIDVNHAKKLMPDTYRMADWEVLEDNRGKYVVKNELYNNNQKFNEETRPTLVFDIYYHPETEEFRCADVDSNHRWKGFVRIPPKQNNDGFHRFHAWRWSRGKIQRESHNLHVEEKDGKYRIYTKIRDFGVTTAKDLITNISGSDNLLKELGIPFFSSPKPLRLIEHLLRLGSGKDSLVMDFFAGSGTTAHAVMKLNQEDGGNRRFILVQWPEKCGEKTEAFKKKFKTIADIAKERLRLAAHQLNAQPSSHSEQELDTGFRVLKIDDSNFQDCRRRPREYQQEDLIHLTDNLRPNRQPLDLLFETMLNLGIDLTVPIHTQTIHNQQVFFLANNQAIACFEEGLTEEFAKTLTTYKPRRVVFRDSGFASDAVRINIGQLFQQLSPSTHLTII